MLLLLLRRRRRRRPAPLPQRLHLSLQRLHAVRISLRFALCARLRSGSETQPRLRRCAFAAAGRRGGAALRGGCKRRVTARRRSVLLALLLLLLMLLLRPAIAATLLLLPLLLLRRRWKRCLIDSFPHTLHRGVPPPSMPVVAGLPCIGGDVFGGAKH